MHDVKFHASDKMAADVAECENFLTLANPVLVRCFEEAENTSSMESSLLECSICNADGSDTEGGISEAESDDDELFHVSVRTEYLMEDSIAEAFFAETCHCKLGVNNDPCSLTLPRRHAVEFCQQCLELSKGKLDIAILGQTQPIYKLFEAITPT